MAGLGLTRLVREDEAYGTAHRSALARLTQGPTWGEPRSLTARILTTVTRFVDTKILVYAEDLNHVQRFGKLEVVNPLG